MQIEEAGSGSFSAARIGGCSTWTRHLAVDPLQVQRRSIRRRNCWFVG